VIVVTSFSAMHAGKGLLNLKIRSVRLNSIIPFQLEITRSIFRSSVKLSMTSIITSNYDINWYGSLMFLDGGNLTFVFSKGSNSIAN
jgi:hypothetical protein